MLHALSIKRLCSLTFFAAFVMLLSGCGGSSSSGSPDDTDANPGIGSLKAGYFTATAAGSSGQSSQMILTPTGECVVIGGSFEELIFCSLDVDDDAISGTLTGYRLVNDQWEVSEAVVSGTVTNPETANLTIKIFGQTGVLEIERDNSVSDRGINLDLISGTYLFEKSQNPSGNFDVSYTVDANGELTGSDGTGCAFNGEVTIPDAKLSIVEVEYTAANCGDDDKFTGEERNGDYSGLGAYEASSGDGAILIVGNNGKIASIFAGVE